MALLVLSLIKSPRSSPATWAGLLTPTASSGWSSFQEKSGQLGEGTGRFPFLQGQGVGQVADSLQWHAPFWSRGWPLRSALPQGGASAPGLCTAAFPAAACRVAF